MRRRVPAIPLGADAGLASAVRRTAAIRVVLGAALVALLAAEVAFARDVSPRHNALVPSGRTTVVVLDLSESIPHVAFPTIARTLRGLAADNVPIGLVIFSDTAYELLPPGTPARELRPLLRFFTPLPGPPSADLGARRFPENPWTSTFRGGTNVSAALALGASLLRRDRGADGSLLLLSDLEIPAQDVPPLTTVLGQLRRDDIALRVVGLVPSPSAAMVFRRLAGPAPFAHEGGAVVPPNGAPAAAPPGASVSWPLVLVALALLLVAAWNEGWLARLPVPRARAREAGA
jgi:hypothetical protein